MKFNKSSQLVLISAAALLVATLLVACGTLTVDFVFVASSKAAGPNSYGQIDVMEINSESGFLRPITTSPFPSGGRNPVAEVVSPDHRYLYVINRDDNSIVQFLIGGDGKLYAQSTINTPGIYPVGLAIDPADKFLYVIDTYQPLPTCSNAQPCSGSIAIFPILPGTPATPTFSGIPAGSLGTATYLPLAGAVPTDNVNPTAMNVLASSHDSAAGSELVVSAVDTTTGTGYIFGYTIANGMLTAVNGSPYPVGIHPTGITSILNGAASTPNNPVYSVFMTDGVNLAAVPNGNNVYSFTAAPHDTVTPGALTNSNQYSAGNAPSAVAADPTGTYLYVTNSVDSNVSAFSISGDTLSPIGIYATGSQPVAILIDPRFGRFVYTANYLGNGVSGTLSGFEIELNPPANSGISTGSLINAQSSPFISNAQPTALAAVPHNGQ